MRRGRFRFGRVLGVPMVLLGGAALGAWWAIGAACDTPRSGGLCGWDAVTYVDVRGVVRLTPDQVRAWAAVPPGAGLIGLDAAPIIARLDRRPWVRKVAIHKRVPGTLVIEVVERVPTAIAKTDRGLFLVDTDGTLIEPTRLDRGFPLVIGGSVSQRHAFVVAAAVLSGYRAAGSPVVDGADVVIDVTTPRDPQVLLPGPVRVRFGGGEYEAKWRRYAAIHREVMGRARGPQLVDLRFQDRAVVTAQGAL
ncbi:MAG: FtsQ-type POTRA domain-containing protein [Nitrospiria bacterium]